ncbi:MAG: hypothetical protein ACLT46_17050 [Hungatella sp.]
MKKPKVLKATVQCYAIEGRIRPVWNIWKKITASRSIAAVIMCFMKALPQTSCRILRYYG